MDSYQQVRKLRACYHRWCKDKSGWGCWGLVPAQIDRKIFDLIEGGVLTTEEEVCQAAERAEIMWLLKGGAI